MVEVARDWYPRLARVFVSSAFRGMAAARDAVAAACRSTGMHAVLTEDLVAWDTSVEQSLRRSLEQCDLYVALFGNARGTTIADASGSFSITEREFLAARDLELRCLVFLDESRRAERDPGLQRFLDDHVLHYGRGVYPNLFTDLAELRVVVAAALAAHRPTVTLAIEPTAAGPQATLLFDRLRPHGSPAATASAPFPLPATLPPAVTNCLRTVLSPQRAALDPAALRNAGGELLAMLSREAQDVLHRALSAQDPEASAPLLLRVRTQDSGQLARPWEWLLLPDHDQPVRNGRLEVVRDPRAGRPDSDPQPARPAPQFSVLGFMAEPAEDESTHPDPDGAAATDGKLFWELEQERLLASLEPALRDRRMRLILPDTGTSAELALQLAQPDRPGILHLSCHGGLAPVDGQRQQVLFVEDDHGARVPLSGDHLLRLLAQNGTAPLPALCLLSACHTGASGTDTPSLAERLVRTQLPRVIGMQAAVSDLGATEFAATLYERIAAGDDLLLAVKVARMALAARGPANEWAIPVLYARDLLAPLVPPPEQRAEEDHPLAENRIATALPEFLALPRSFVGRRSFDRRFAAAWQASSRVVVLHGLGGLGKSTQAGHILLRRHQEGWRSVILRQGIRHAGQLLDEVAAELNRQAGNERLRRRPEDKDGTQFAADLKLVLAERRTLFLFDNFEDNQGDDGALRDAALGEAIDRLLDLAGPESRLLLTTRVALKAPAMTHSIANIDLGELSPAEARKLRQHLVGLRWFGFVPAALAKDDARRAAHAKDQETWHRVLRVLGGHPKALELLDRHLRSSPDAIWELLADADKAFAMVAPGLGRERQERGRKLLVDQVVAALPKDARPVLRRLALLQAPLPTRELIELLAADGIEKPVPALAALRERGVLGQTVAPSAILGGDLVHRLVGHETRNELREKEGEPAWQRWHRAAAKHFRLRPRTIADFEHAVHHALAIGDAADALAAYAVWSLALCRFYSNRAALDVVSDARRRVPDRTASLAWTHLELVAEEAHRSLGETDGASKALARAETLLQGMPEAQAAMTFGKLYLAQAGAHATRGEMQDALRRCRHAADVLSAAGADREVAIARGGEARLRAQAGDIQGALKLHEERLAIFERLHDVRMRAITLGDIAHLRAQAGDIGGASKLHQEELQVYERLNDVRSSAVTLGDIARLMAQAGDIQGALKLHEERLVILERLNDVRSRALTLGDIARLRAQAGDIQGALKLQEESLAIFDRLNDVRSRALTLGDIAHLRTRAGDIQGALKLHQEELQVYERLNDVRSRAITLGDIARLRAQAGDIQGALKLHEERLVILQRLNDVRSRAITLGDIARLRAQAGDIEGALKLHEESLGVFRRLNDVDGIANAQWSIGSLQPDPTRSLPPLAEAWALIQRLGRIDGIAAIGTDYGKRLLQAQDPAGTKVLAKARAAALRIGRRDAIEHIDAILRQVGGKEAAGS